MKRCPACGKTDQVAKVSIIYMEGLQRRKAAHKTQPVDAAAGIAGNTPLPPVFAQMQAPALQALSTRLKPPASGKELPVRPVHPDLIILVFSLATPLFLYQIITSQPGTLYPVLIVLAIFYGVYFWRRTKILAKFEREKESRRLAEGQVRRGIERWMRLYYCARDDGVFTPGASEAIPIDQIQGYLMQE